MNQNKKPEIENLLRGVSTGHVETVRDAWKHLLGDDKHSIQAVKTKLDSSAWADNPRGPITEYLGVLLSLLSELDSQEFKYEVDRLLESNLHPINRQTVEILSRRYNDTPAIYIGSGIPVYISSDIATPSVVVGNLERWSRTKGLVFDGVTRVDVIAYNPQLEYLGLYNLFFSGIVLTWPADNLRGLNLWRRKLRAERTFYHEIGHHFHGHIEGGQVAQQEKEADDYARSMIRKSHPILTSLVRVFLLPFKLFLRMRASNVD